MGFLKTVSCPGVEGKYQYHLYMQDHFAVWVTLVLTCDCTVESVEVGGESSAASASSHCGLAAGLSSSTHSSLSCIRYDQAHLICIKKTAQLHPLYESSVLMPQHLVPCSGLV
jgi:hypothetical protein